MIRPNGSLSDTEEKICCTKIYQIMFNLNKNGSSSMINRYETYSVTESISEALFPTTSTLSASVDSIE